MNRPVTLFPPGDAPDILSRTECETIARRVLSFAKAEETRVTINSSARSNTRFAGNQITTSGDAVDATVTVWSAFGKRSASVTTNKLGDDDLVAAVRQAETIARLSTENPEAMPELGEQRYTALSEHAAPAPSAANRAAAVKAVCDRARRAKCVATGYIETDFGAMAVANSRGLFAYTRFGGSAMTTTVRTPDGTGSGWAGADTEQWGDIDAAELGATATEKALRSRHPVAVEPGRYTVILEPTAVGDLVQLVVGEMDARTADEGRSCFSKPGGGSKIGERIADERVTLVSDPADRTGSGVTSEGLPTRRVVWVDRGVLTNLDYDRYWAQKSGVQPTAAPEDTLRMSGGTTSLTEMIKSTQQGILVTRFWYLRGVDPRTLLYTGLTRDGTFLIEKGQVTKAAKNFRFNDSPLSLLHRIDSMGVPARVCASEGSGAGSTVIVPPLKCVDFMFTSLSDAV